MTRRWLTILVPVVVVAAIETLSDSVLDALLPFPRDTILVVAVVAGFAALGGWLAWRSIDRLRETLERRNRELEVRAGTTRALHQVGLAIAALADLDAILRVIVESARELLGADVALVARTMRDGSLHLSAFSGSAELLVRDPGTPEDASAFIVASARVAELAAPLRRGETTMGALVVGSTLERSYGVDDIEILATLATQAAIAIENAGLHESLRELAVRGERERIARELHDGLAQVLGYVNTKSQAVEELLGTGRSDEARVHLSELAAAARSVYVDVREAILGLSTPVLESGGLATAIESYAQRFAEASKVAVAVAASDGARTHALPPAVEAQSFRIVQEALTNIRKHASANRARIDVDVRDGRLEIEVSDDGRGIEAGSATPDGWPRFGIVSMRERAASVGGTVDVESVPAAGTVVHVSIPLEDAVMVAAR